MKVVILAGGRGTRLGEETETRPKPMIEIGGKPMLWHIMSIYASHGFSDFVVACGYRGELIKQYFSSVFLHASDYVVNLKDGSRRLVNSACPDWRVWLIDTGLETMTGGRLLRLKEILGDEPFMLTYGDGVGNVDVASLVAFHRAHGRTATVTAVRPPARYGALTLTPDNAVRTFREKPQAGEGWINGGFFVFEPAVFEYLEGDTTALEAEPLERLAEDRQLMAFLHPGFWHPMDTLRDKKRLESLWTEGAAPWLQNEQSGAGATSSSPALLDCLVRG